jgi:osmotically inducible lipoprotein OsmB
MGTSSLLALSQLSDVLFSPAKAGERNLYSIGATMKKLQKMIMPMAAGVLFLSLSACESLSEEEEGTAIGAGVGGVAGSVLTEGGTLGTLGGAAAGGVIGNEVAEDDEVIEEDDGLL